MNNFDFLVIYLTCGAPLGVFYFLRHYKKQNDFQIWLKTFFTFIFWLPFGFRLLEDNLRKKFFAGQNIYAEISEKERKISQFQKQFEDVLQESDLPISIFEFREVFERYIGLTVAADCSSRKTTETEREIFRVSNGGNAEIGAICVKRRNRKRLIVHQNKARQNFFQIISRLISTASDKTNFVKSATDFFRLLKDAEMQTAFEEFPLADLPRAKDFVANYSEHHLWNTKSRQRQTAKPASGQLQTLTTATNLRSKD